MSFHSPREGEMLSSPSNPTSKKYDLLQKIQRLGAKQKYKFNLTKMAESPKSSNYQPSEDSVTFQLRKDIKIRKDQHQIISGLKSQLLTIKEDVSRLVGKQKATSITQSNKNKRIIMSPSSNDGQSLASENVNMYRYKHRKEGFRPRSDSYNSSEERSFVANDMMTEVPAINRKRQINLNVKGRISPRIQTQDFAYFDQQRMFKKQPNNYWSPRAGEGMPLRNMSEELMEAQQTIMHLEGVIEDSNTIKRGLQTKIASMKRLNQRFQDPEEYIWMKEQLYKQQMMRMSLQQRVEYLTSEIETLQYSLQESVVDTSRSNTQHAESRLKGQRQQTNKFKDGQPKNPQVYESKLKSLQEAHNREVLGLKTQLKLCKLRLEKSESQNSKTLSQNKPPAPARQNTKKLQQSKQKLEISIFPDIKHPPIIAQAVRENQVQFVEKKSLAEGQSQTEVMEQVEAYKVLKRQSIQLKSINCSLEVRIAELQSENSRIDYKYQCSKQKFSSLMQIKERLEQATSLQREELNSTIEGLRLKMAGHQEAQDIAKSSLSTALQQNAKLIKEIQHKDKQLAQVQVQIKVNQETIKQLNARIASFQQESRSIQSKFKAQINQKKGQIENLLNDNRRLTQLYAGKCKEDTNLKSSRLYDFESLERRNQELQLENEKLHAQIEEQQYRFKADISDIKLQYKSRSSSISESAKKGFDEELKQHLQQILRLKQELQEKKDLIIQLKEECRSLRTLADNNRAELEIQKLRGISERKNITVAFQVEIQNLKNQLAFVRKTSNSIDSKLKLLNEQNKRKDEFLQKYILGKNISPEFKVEVVEFFRRFQEQFSIDRLKQRVYEQTRVIQKLMQENSILVRNICELRQQLVARAGQSFEDANSPQEHGCQEQNEAGNQCVPLREATNCQDALPQSNQAGASHDKE